MNAHTAYARGQSAPEAPALTMPEVQTSPLPVLRLPRFQLQAVIHAPSTEPLLDLSTPQPLTVPELPAAPTLATVVAAPAPPQVPTAALRDTASWSARQQVPAAPAAPAAPAEAIRPLNPVAAGLLLVSTTAMLYAAQMSGSVALLACAGLFLSDLSLGLRGLSARVCMAAALALTLWALIGVPGQFSDMAFVAGLFVVVAAVPVLAMSAVAGRLLRRDDASTADLAVRARGKYQLLAVVLAMLAGVQAFRSFSAVPDALVTLSIVAMVAHAMVARHRRP